MVSASTRYYSFGKFLFSVSAAIFCFFTSRSQNAVVTENALPGSPSSQWDISGAGDLSIQGFATDISVNRGQTIYFKINTDASAYVIDIYRLGYYQGNGARLVGTGTITAMLPQVQPPPLTDPVTGLIDCGNWSESAHWDVPAAAVSGIYIAKLTRTDNGGASHIVFVVRDDSGTSDLFFQTSDATWQAYNVYGGNSLYTGSTSYPGGHAAKVSYNRPFITRAGGGGGGAEEDWLFNAEYPMVRWLERNGYDVSYTTCVDADRYGSLILNHKVFLSVGHDEYWSGQQLDNVTAARDAGVHLAFFSGNEIYWKTRWEPSTDATNTAYRTLVCYKEGTMGEYSCGMKCDPLPNVWTGLWRDGCNFSSADGCRPENALSGQISWDGTTGAIEVPDACKSLRFWRNTSVAALGAGQTTTLTQGSLGYEWDWQQYLGTYPRGRILLSKTILNGHTHHLSLYRAQSGALVFGAGTVQWSWGLDGIHDRGGSVPDTDMQQATVNLFADMDVQPASLQAGLMPAFAGTDIQEPVSVITSPAAGALLANGVSLTISGTATDNNTVAGVDISVDSGATWLPADGTNNWTFTWVTSGQGPVTIMSRAFDDAGNIETVITISNTIVDTVEAPGPAVCPCTIFQPSAFPAVPLTNDNSLGIETGMKFRSDQSGYVSGVRFYKGAGTTGVHLGHLWDKNQQMLAEAAFINESASGWQEAYFIPPVPVHADSTYVISCHSSSGDYAYTSPYFTTAVVNGHLKALADGEEGANGVYKYSNAPAYPTDDFQSSNYWVDVIFDVTSGIDTVPPAVIAISPAANDTMASVAAVVSVKFNESIDISTLNTSTFILYDATNSVVSSVISYNGTTHLATLTPTVPLAYASAYHVVVKGGTGYQRVKDAAGNALPADYTWTFTTKNIPAPPPISGLGGPILLISSSANPFSSYASEILRAEGFNEFGTRDILQVTQAVLDSYDVVLLGEIALSATHVTLFANWVNAGGVLIAFRPDAQLAGLLGLAPVGTTLSDKYLLVNSAAPAATGIVNQTIQFHGQADLYTLNGAIAVATLYSDVNTATSYPAVTQHSVGANGGQAIAFTYDLARSVVYTRQGNPAWAGQKRDGQPGPVRSDDLFYPDWIDMTKVAIPQADEQQHLLSNLIIKGNLHHKPLPRFWFLPKGLKAAVIMTGDNHGDGGMQPRFDINIQESTAGCSVDDWECIRSTGYLYLGSSFNDSMAQHYNSLGFEVALHVNTGCNNYTAADLNNYLTGQLADFANAFPGIPAPVTNRTHCIAWSDWSSQPELEAEQGIRLDLNYYYWPASWVNNQPGMFTGSGMPMRFAKVDGTLIDCYQAATQMPDESGEIFPQFCDALLDKALGAEGYYGVFSTNMHFDNTNHADANAIVASAKAHGVPVVSAKQMLTWLDGRNNSAFSILSWNNDTLKFIVTAAAGSKNMQAMLPVQAGSGQLSAVLYNGAAITYTVQTIKGIDYAFIQSPGGNYEAIYNAASALVISNVMAAPSSGGTAMITWNTNFVSDSKVEFGTAPGLLVNSDSSAVQVTNHSITLSGLNAGTYYYRVSSKTNAGDSATEPVLSSAPLSFIIPGGTCATDHLAADFAAGVPDANISIAQAGDGELILKPAAIEEFSGAVLPAAWQSGTWNAGGTVTVGSGQLVADGASASTVSGFTPGISLEFVATFQPATFQNVGFTADAGFNSPWVTIGQGSTAGSLYARTDDGTSILLGSSLTGSPHYYRIDWNTTDFAFYVDSVLTTTISKTVGSSMVTMISDFNTGGGAIQVDWMRITPYAASGSFTSRVFDYGDTTNWGAATWAAAIPAGTSLDVSVRTGNVPVPDGTWTAFQTVSLGAPVNASAQYLQYRADLTTSDAALTPALYDISIACAATGTVCTTPAAFISAEDPTVCMGEPIRLKLDSAQGSAPFNLTINNVAYSNVFPGQIFATINTSAASIWGSGGTPVNPNGNDGQPIEVGTKFHSSVSGYVTGVRFYKGAANTGTHVGSLWTRSGVQLASVIFGAETASGWQEAHFAMPVYIQADTTYIISCYSQGGGFAISPGYFGSAAVTTGALTALQSGTDGPNGVYKYGGGFPNTGGNANYWVDVLFQQQSSNQTLSFVLTNVTDSNNCSASGSSLDEVTVTIRPLPSGEITSAAPVCDGQTVDLVYSDSATSAPFSLLINGMTYNGVNNNIPFSTGTQISSAPVSIWSSSAVPGTPSQNLDSASIELGVKFRAAVPGKISGIRFYKGAPNTGTHTGSLWSSAGTQLATATFSSETASGWQQVLFSSPVPVSANTTYIASYHAPNGKYAFDGAYFSASAVINGPLKALQNGEDGMNGLYSYGSGSQFPNQSFNAANYWVDVIFEPDPSTVFLLAAVTDSSGCDALIDADPLVIAALDSMKITVASLTNVQCKGMSNGAAAVSVTGGSGNYIYAWSDPLVQATPAALNLQAGTYTLNVTDTSGCNIPASATVTITEPAQDLATTMIAVDVLCNGDLNGMAAVNASGGTAPYAYSWSAGSMNDTITALAAGSYTVAVTDANGCIKNDTAVIGQPLSLALQSSHVNVNCFGDSTGAAAVIAAGGTMPYFYTWSHDTVTQASVTGLVAGNYSVQVTDANGCQINNAFTITQPPSLFSFQSSKTDVSCFGGATGSASVNVTGVTGPFTYAWSPGGSVQSGISNIIAGNYTVQVTDANNCTQTATILISEPPQIISLLISANAHCGQADGSAVMLVAGGAGNYSFLWSDVALQANDTATGLVPGTYSVTVTDGNGCSKTDSVIVGNSNGPAVAVTADASAFCLGDSTGLTANGAIAYTWSPASGLSTATGSAVTATPAVTTTYWVTGEDAYGCSDSASVTVIVYQPPVVPVVSNTGDTLYSTAVSGNQWYLDSVAIAGATAQSYVATQEGYYSVTVTDNNGCSSASAPFYLSITGMGTGNYGNSIAVYPNPSSGVFTIERKGGAGEKITISLYNSEGKLVREETFEGTKAGFTKTVNASPARAGVYNLIVRTESSMQSFRLIIE